MNLVGVILVLSLAVATSETIQTSDGDLVKCIDRKHQPAFNHSLLKNHKLQEINKIYIFEKITELPSEIPKMVETGKPSKWHTSEAHVSTANCPQGTIPTRLYGDTIDQTKPATSSFTPGHEYAIITTKSPPKLYGARTTINVWKPRLENEKEMSISQLWISSGDYTTDNVNTIEIGWQVLPELYKDNKPRLFLFWTSNTYRNGCYNLQCPGFIQTSSSIVLGGAITPISSFGGNQYEITILVWKDPKSGNWWLTLGPNNTLVGYWPAEIFTTLADYAEVVEWGGEIINSESLGRHTATEMGSGHFPVEGFGKSSYFRNLEIVYNNTLQPIQDLKKKITNSKSYDVEDMYTEERKRYFFYGGPGFKPGQSGADPLVFGSLVSYLALTFFLLV